MFLTDAIHYGKHVSIFEYATEDRKDYSDVVVVDTPETVEETYIPLTNHPKAMHEAIYKTVYKIAITHFYMINHRP